MQEIKLNDINLDKFEKCKIQGTKSITYYNENYCIKILDRFFSCESYCDTLYKKLTELDGIILDDVLMPKALILYNGFLVGYVMEYFKNSINVFDYLTTGRFVNCKEIFKITKQASLILRKVHKAGIIYQDLSFENILINDEGIIKYSDIEGCTFKSYEAIFISRLLKRFLSDYKNEPFFQPSQNMDRISFILSFYSVIYLQELQKLSKRKYHALADKISTLKNCDKYAEMLLKSASLPEIPYLNEVINENDNYVIDREKQITFKEKIFRMFS